MSLLRWSRSRVSRRGPRGPCPRASAGRWPRARQDRPGPCGRSRRGSAVVENPVDDGCVPLLALPEHALLRHPGLGRDALRVELSGYLRPDPVSRKRLNIQRTVSASCGVHDQLVLLAIHIVAEHGMPPQILAFLLGARDLVPDPVADHLALELGKESRMLRISRPIDVVGVEVLGDRDERHVVLVEKLDEPGEVEE